jgi:hypothetical protein
MRRPVCLVAVLLALPPAMAWARVLMDQQQALRAAFPPPAAVERRTLYLDPGQVRRAVELAGVPVESRVVTYYVASAGPAAQSAILGYAYFDTHLVRTLPESIMIVVEPEGRIRQSTSCRSTNRTIISRRIAGGSSFPGAGWTTTWRSTGAFAR